MAWGDVAQGAGTGSTMGAAVGSLIPGPGTAIGTIAGGVLGGAAGGLFGRQDKETPTQGKQRELIDQMLASLNGNGPFSHLFNVDENAFQKSFVDPMKQKFQSQIAPQIQQSYISSGQQRGTSLDDTLTRAGVDMDQMLNQFYSQQQQQAQSNQMNAMNNILGAGAGAPRTPTAGQAAMQGLGGYLAGDKFGKDVGNVVGSFTDRKGFEGDTRGKNELTDYTAPLEKKNQVYNPYTGTQE